MPSRRWKSLLHRRCFRSTLFTRSCGFSIAFLLSLIFALGYGYIAAYNPRIESFFDRCAGHSSIHPRAELSAGGDARHGLADSGAAARHRNGRHPADLYRAGLEYRLQLLLIAQEHAARIARSLKDLSLFSLAAILATRIALRGDRAGLEFHGLCRRRLVLPDGLRNVCAGQPRFPLARARLLPADRRQHRRCPRHALGLGDHDPHHRGYGSIDLASGDRLVRQIQVRAGREQQPQ